MDENVVIKEVLKERIIEHYNLRLKYRLMFKKRITVGKMKERNDYQLIQMAREK